MYVNLALIILIFLIPQAAKTVSSQVSKTSQAVGFLKIETAEVCILFYVDSGCGNSYVDIDCRS